MKFTTFTTRPDTIFGVTFLVMAPEHPKALEITTEENLEEVKKYIQATKNKSDRERQINKEKSGIFTGSYVKHPITGKNIPVWLADYVLYSYGTGVVMAVPAHDQRDFEFAKKYGLTIKPVIKNPDSQAQDLNKAFEAKGIMQNSGDFNDKDSEEAKQEISEFLVNQNKGKAKTNYKFRDWVFSRQRYWGEPFPFEYLEK
jgi:leucyl-tRNA synthetase